MLSVVEYKSTCKRNSLHQLHGDEWPTSSTSTVELQSIPCIIFLSELALNVCRNMIVLK